MRSFNVLSAFRFMAAVIGDAAMLGAMALKRKPFRMNSRTYAMVVATRAAVTAIMARAGKVPG